MPLTLTRADGVYIVTKATLAQLAADDILRQFATGLIARAVAYVPPDYRAWSITKALLHSGPEFNSLLTALLVLDTEVKAIIADETRTFPLPGFLTYRSRLPLEKFPPHLLRLPPLNPDGHYVLLPLNDEGGYLAARMDIHPALRLAGHVRLALSRARHTPGRLQPLEHRLERQVLDQALLEAALAEASDLAPAELSALRQLLTELAARR